MITQDKTKLQNFLALFVIGGLPFYYFLRELFIASSFIYGGLLFILFLVCFYQNIANKRIFIASNRTFLLIEMIMLLNILFVFLYLGHIERNLVLLFIVLFISKCMFITNNKYDFKFASNIITGSALIAVIGVILGLIELMIGNTNFFTQVIGFDYPYSDGLGKTTLINGFFASANGSAYAIGAGIAFIQFQDFANGVFKKALYMVFVIALFATKAKFAFLIAASLLGFTLLRRFSLRWLGAYLLILATSYIFLSHIMIAAPGTYDYPSLHFRELLFTLGSVDFILGNYGAFKLYALEAILSNNFMPIGLDVFVEVYGGRPHFMLGALIISGGFVSAILVIFYIYLLLKEFSSHLLIGLNRNKLYLVVLFCFALESINWNFTNSFYFWAIIMGLGSIGGQKDIKIT